MRRFAHAPPADFLAPKGWGLFGPSSVWPDGRIPESLVVGRNGNRCYLCWTAAPPDGEALSFGFCDFWQSERCCPAFDWQRLRAASDPGDASTVDCPGCAAVGDARVAFAPAPNRGRNVR